ncbi:MAG: thioredoxin [Clostridia bacterium]|nr:thioredoxin [Clostridia bacterium]
MIVRLVILAVAVTLIVLGILNGGMRDVLGKAIKICTECIGLG